MSSAWKGGRVYLHCMVVDPHLSFLLTSCQLSSFQIIPVFAWWLVDHYSSLLSVDLTIDGTSMLCSFWFSLFSMDFIPFSLSVLAVFSSQSRVILRQINEFLHFSSELKLSCFARIVNFINIQQSIFSIVLHKHPAIT